MSLQLIGTTQTNSTLLAYDGSTEQVSLYSAFGNTSNTQNGLLPGFNGERPDPFTGATHLGNGYRAYNPILMRFTCPDSESPFGVGGINPYAYCENDPVNFTDPSGHGIFRLAIRGLASLFKFFLEEDMAEAVAKGVAKTTKYTLTYGSLVSSKITKAISYIVESNNPQAAERLRIASMALGSLYSVTSLYSNSNNIYKNVKKLRSREGAVKVEQTLSDSFTGLDASGNERGLADEIVEEINEGLASRADNATHNSLRSLQHGEGVQFDNHNNQGWFQSLTNMSKTPVYQIATSSISIVSTVLGKVGDIEKITGNESAARALNITSSALSGIKYILKVPSYIEKVKTTAHKGRNKIRGMGRKPVSTHNGENVQNGGAIGESDV